MGGAGITIKTTDACHRGLQHLEIRTEIWLALLNAKSEIHISSNIRLNIIELALD